MNERPIPPAALEDSKAVEMLRVWVANRSLQCSLLVGKYRDSGIRETRAWGTILADAARHVAGALHKMDGDGDDEAELLRQIREEFLAELRDPTSEASGDFV